MPLHLTLIGPRPYCVAAQAATQPTTSSRRNSAASSGTSHASTASSPAALGAALRSSSSPKETKPKREPLSPREIPPELQRLVHPSSSRLGNPTEKPGRGAYRSCDACSRRREKCDRYTVCGSCIIHETLCIWSNCKPLYERRGSLPGGASDDLVAARQAEVDRLRSTIGDLAAQVGLRAEDLLDPEKIQRYLRNGLPPSRSPSQDS
ncbi:hypothetical protein JCM3774_004244 [Rhodotorula dairenensis]